MIYSITHTQLEEALTQWMEDYNASPETFDIYQEGESEKDYGVAATRTLLNYVFKGDINVAE